MKAADCHTQRGSSRSSSSQDHSLALAAAVLTAAALAAPATAHVQVRPTVAAPGDPVLFEVIVPGESDAKTVQVTLQVPKERAAVLLQRPAGLGTGETAKASDGSLVGDRLAGRASRRTASRASPSWLRRPSRRATSSGRRCSRYDDGERRALDRRPRLREPGGGDQGHGLRAARRTPVAGRAGEVGGRGRGRAERRRATVAAPATAPDRRRTTTARCHLILGDRRARRSRSPRWRSRCARANRLPLRTYTDEPPARPPRHHRRRARAAGRRLGAHDRLHDLGQEVRERHPERLHALRRHQPRLHGRA